MKPYQSYPVICPILSCQMAHYAEITHICANLSKLSRTDFCP
jgi:hypothetical protein